MAPDSAHRGRHWRRLLGCLLAVLGVGLVVAAILLKYEPALMAATAPGPDAERAAARVVTTASGLYAALGQPGPWGAAITDTEANAWLAIDLPRNHPTLLPHGLADPRVRFGRHRIEAAVRFGSGLLSTVVRCDVGVTLRGVNQLGITVEGASAGAVPIPRIPVLAEFGRRITACGAVTELRRLDGRTMLVVYIPPMSGGGGPRWRLESLLIDDGEAAVAGSTMTPEPTPAGAAVHD